MVIPKRTRTLFSKRSTRDWLSARPQRSVGYCLSTRIDYGFVWAWGLDWRLELQWRRILSGYGDMVDSSSKTLSGEEPSSKTGRTSSVVRSIQSMNWNSQTRYL